MQRPYRYPSRQYMSITACFVPMESRNYFHHGELLLVAFREVHSRSPFAKSSLMSLRRFLYRIRINQFFSSTVTGSDNFINQSMIIVIYFKAKLRNYNLMYTLAYNFCHFFRFIKCSPTNNVNIVLITNVMIIYD